MPVNNQEMLFQLIEEYWSKNPQLEFGAILDNVLSSRKSKKKDLYYTTTAEWIHILTDSLSEPEEFDRQSLVALRGDRFKRYNEHPEKFKEEPKSLFIEGLFNPSNFVGGDDIIHLFFNAIFIDGQLYGSTQVERDGSTLQLSYDGSYLYNEEEEVHSFIFNLNGINLDTLKPVMHSSIFKIDEKNDRFKTAWFDGRVMVEDEYIFLLNAIQKSGFDFRIGDFSDNKY